MTKMDGRKRVLRGAIFSARPGNCMRGRELASRSWRTVIIITLLQIVIPTIVSMLLGRFRIKTGVPAGEGKKSVSLNNNIYQQISALFNIFIVPLMSIVPALLYLKMRQLGGDSLADALAQIEVDDESREWQRRMKTRLSLHTPRSTRKDSQSHSPRQSGALPHSSGALSGQRDTPGSGGSGA